MKLHYIENAQNAIKSLIKKKRLSARQERDVNDRKRKYHNNPEKKKKGS